LAQIYCQQSARQPGDIISERRATSSRNQRATSSESADMAEQFPGLTFQGSGSADVDYLLNFLSITNYTDDLLGDPVQ
jgi:hypothetical protein